MESKDPKSTMEEEMSMLKMTVSDLRERLQRQDEALSCLELRAVQFVRRGELKIAVRDLLLEMRPHIMESLRKEVELIRSQGQGLSSSTSNYDASHLENISNLTSNIVKDVEAKLCSSQEEIFTKVHSEMFAMRDWVDKLTHQRTKDLELLQAELRHYRDQMHNNFRVEKSQGHTLVQMNSGLAGNCQTVEKFDVNANQ